MAAGYGEGRLTDEELEVVNVLAVGSPSCADVAFLLLQGLEEKLQRLLPVGSGLDWEDQAFCYRHFGLFVED